MIDKLDEEYKWRGRDQLIFRDLNRRSRGGGGNRMVEHGQGPTST
jgi:hypothetical protein